MEQQVIPVLRGRTSYIEQQEPEFNVQKQAFQQAQQQKGQK